MESINNLTDLENQVFQVSSKDYKAMMLSPGRMNFISKRVVNEAEFLQAFEKGGLLAVHTTVTPEKLKSVTVEQGELKLTLNYKKMLEFGVPGELEFSSESALTDVLTYIEKKWFFRRIEKPLTPFKAIIPYLIALVGTVYITGFAIYHNIVGGSFRTSILLVLFVKLSEKIGFIPTIILGLLAIIFIVRALWKAFKNPPIEIRLEPI